MGVGVGGWGLGVKCLRLGVEDEWLEVRRGRYGLGGCGLGLGVESWRSHVGGTGRGFTARHDPTLQSASDFIRTTTDPDSGSIKTVILIRTEIKQNFNPKPGQKVNRTLIPNS